MKVYWTKASEPTTWKGLGEFWLPNWRIVRFVLRLLGFKVYDPTSLVP